ncbi:MAG: S1/P1 nuclease [Chthoniobacteraceae bacterium]
MENKDSSGTSDADAKKMLFMFASTWPDAIKPIGSYALTNPDSTSQPKSKYVATGGDIAANDPNAKVNMGYQDDDVHKYWHFVDCPFSTDTTALPPIPTPNALERIILFRSVLKSNAADDLKSYDLVWLIHLVGDVHQPLHCTTRFSAALPKGDAGGNEEAVAGGFAKSHGDHLHTYWDRILGLDAGKNLFGRIGNTVSSLPITNPTKANDTHVKDWVGDSFQIAKSFVYPNLTSESDGTMIISKTYEDQALVIAKQQAALAGARLAKLINDNLR